MEASGLFGRFSQHVDPGDFHIIKIVSDYTDGVFPSKKSVRKLIDNSLGSISQYLIRIARDYNARVGFNLKAKAKINALCTEYKLTNTQVIKLRRLCLYLCHQGDINLIQLSWPDCKNLTTNKRNSLFNKIICEIIQ